MTHHYINSHDTYASKSLTSVSCTDTLFNHSLFVYVDEFQIITDNLFVCYNLVLHLVLQKLKEINPFAPGDFAEKRVWKLVALFSGHCRSIKS